MSLEPTAAMPGDRPTLSVVGRLLMRARSRRTAMTPKLARDMQRPTGDAQKPLERLLDGHPEVVDLDDFVLPRHHFLMALQRERRRADRTKSPLSLALFRYDGARTDEVTRDSQLLALFRKQKRETDILGDLGARTIALILPDTNSQGTKEFAKRLAVPLRALQFSITTGTYPDDLFDDLLKGRLRDLTQAHPLFIDRRPGSDKLGNLIKRSIDVVGAATGIVLLSPVMLVTAATIALTSPGPVIYRQIRLGKGGVPFTFYKFRSMRRDGGDQIHREYVISLISGGEGRAADGSAPKLWAKLQSDPRVTPVGRFIRRTSIDELPQLFNVLKGDLSLIGPRPALTYEAEEYQSWHLRRILQIKPGVSGLWQVEGGSNVTFDDMVRLDLQYVRTRSLMLDLKIMVKTIMVVFQRGSKDF
jgi:lipopolysaccharide/colanic/teichoic acid biosynthesis glycosyltransferase